MIAAGSTWNRFEAGTPNIAGVVGLRATVDFLECLRREAILEHERDLVDHARERLGQLPAVRVIGPPSREEMFGRSVLFDGGDSST